MEKQKSTEYFSELAKFYQAYSIRNQEYLDSINNIIIAEIENLKAKCMLDIGTGDGRRAMEISVKSFNKDIVLVEPNSAMIEQCKKADILSGESVSIYQMTAEELEIEGKYDVITCLWNVLGHLHYRIQRIMALKKMTERLSEKGKIFIDVNNRYNIKAYVIFYTTRDLLKDLLDPKDSNGDVTYYVNLNGKSIQGFGHLFNPKEIESIINEAGLRIVKEAFIDYKTGEQRKYYWQGQLYFELKNNLSSIQTKY